MENLFDGCCDFTEVGHQHQTQEGQVFGRGAPQAHEGLRKLSVSRPHPPQKNLNNQNHVLDQYCTNINVSSLRSSLLLIVKINPLTFGPFLEMIMDFTTA